MPYRTIAADGSLGLRCQYLPKFFPVRNETLYAVDKVAEDVGSYAKPHPHAHQAHPKEQSYFIILEEVAEDCA